MVVQVPKESSLLDHRGQTVDVWLADHSATSELVERLDLEGIFQEAYFSWAEHAQRRLPLPGSPVFVGSEVSGKNGTRLSVKYSIHGSSSAGVHSNKLMSGSFCRSPIAQQMVVAFSLCIHPHCLPFREQATHDGLTKSSQKTFLSSELVGMGLRLTK